MSHLFILLAWLESFMEITVGRTHLLNRTNLCTTQAVEEHTRLITGHNLVYYLYIFSNLSSCSSVCATSPKYCPVSFFHWSWSYILLVFLFFFAFPFWVSTSSNYMYTSLLSDSTVKYAFTLFSCLTHGNPMNNALDQTEITEQFSRNFRGLQDRLHPVGMWDCQSLLSPPSDHLLSRATLLTFFSVLSFSHGDETSLSCLTFVVSPLPPNRSAFVGNQI